MASKAELQAQIDADNTKIQEIEDDITAMQDEQTTFNGYISTFSTNKDNVDGYDMTVGGTWKKNLCDTAQTKQTTISTGIGNAITQCNTVISDLSDCITTAEGMISDLEADIAACEEAIREIEAAEEEAAKKASK